MLARASVIDSENVALPVYKSVYKLKAAMIVETPFCMHATQKIVALPLQSR
jgi:hypothetical protein